jgi:hypothetical protein
MDQYAELGIPINVSEITIPGAESVGGDTLQAEITEKLYRIWFSHLANSQIVWWNLVDGTAGFAPQGTNQGENRFKGGLLNYDFTPKPVHGVIPKLIHQEWTTHATLKYAAGGINKFHGFYGDYDVTVKTDGGTFQTSLSLYKGALNKIKLQLT